MKKFLSALLLTVFIAPQAMADEGMWLLQLMRQQNLKEKMAEAGLQISVDEIYSPDAPSLKDAIGIFGGGCTGEVVSPNGLVLTNHHCGFSFIQQLSTVDGSTHCSPGNGRRGYVVASVDAPAEPQGQDGRGGIADIS